MSSCRIDIGAGHSSVLGTILNDAVHWAGWLSAALAAFGCEPFGKASVPAASNPTSRPTFARIAITDLTIAPMKPGGRPWDGLGGALSAGDSAELAAALGAANPYLAVASILERPTMQAIDAPEVTGSATLFVRAAQQPAQSFRGPRDSFRPSLSPQPTWLHVPLDGTARIRIEVMDKDFEFSDAIGACEISGRDLQATVQAGNIVQIKVAEQTGNTILFVGLSAIRE